MGRVALVALILALVSLAGCSDGGSPDDPSEESDDFGVEATETKGVLLGVVVDEAIRPIADAKVSINVGEAAALEDTSDTEGRFAFGDLEPGIYLVQISHLQFTSATSSVEVAAGEEDPPVHRFQIVRLFDQEPFTEMITFDGFLQCAFNIGASSTCVNDYTRVIGCLDPAACVCPGGCFRDQELAKQGGNQREYVSQIGAGWQSIIFETTWEPTSDTGEELGFTVSFYSRPDATHRYGGASGPNPLRLQLDTGVEHEDAAQGSADHTIVPANGTEELFVFHSAGGPIAINQKYTAYQTTYYYAIPEEGWSFIVNGPPPF